MPSQGSRILSIQGPRSHSPMLVPIIRRHMPAFSPICCKADVLLFFITPDLGLSPTKRATLVRSLSIVLEDRPKIWHLRQAVRLRLDNVAQGCGHFSSLLMHAPLQHFLSDDPTNAVCSPTVLSSITWTRNKNHTTHVLPSESPCFHPVLSVCSWANRVFSTWPPSDAD